ncbi:hypothetical protein PHMEG_0005550 [Phytophthora megakarya]|uniref:Integrase zinc-binding domain-containing protein n=1 Tax=Phytophthora megakarya TaxID=4795 RepID=A0A225WR47_9STRA|nr:hypothetical protein PHMEG_0005550 [Phytophthora megakarya]
MIQEFLQNCHDSIEGGHQGVFRSHQRVKLNYYWTGLYADVTKHVQVMSRLAYHNLKDIRQETCLLNDLFKWYL